MADGTRLDPGSGGDNILTIDLTAGAYTGMKGQGIVLGTVAAGAWTAIATGNPLAVQPVGTVAHDAADSGNPVKTGGRARTTDIAAVASDDRVDAIFDALGRQLITPYASPENLLSGAPAVIVDTTSTEVIAAQGAGVRIYVTSVVVSNSDATVSTVVSLTDGSGGTVKHRGYALAGGGGWSLAFPTPIRLTANTALHAVCATTSAEVYVSVTGFKAAL